jgi:hypothetical protein
MVVPDKFHCMIFCKVSSVCDFCTLNKNMTCWEVTNGYKMKLNFVVWKKEFTKEAFVLLDVSWNLLISH